MSQIKLIVGCTSEAFVDGDESAMARIVCVEGSYDTQMIQYITEREVEGQRYSM